MIGLRRALWVLAGLGAMLIALAVAIFLSSDHIEDPVAGAVTGALLMGTWIGVGLFAWSRRPSNRVGMLMAATGFLAFLNALTASDNPVVFGLGAATGSAFLAVAAHMLVAFPTGRVEGRALRAFVVAFYVVALPVQVVWILFTRDCDCGPRTPENGLVIADVPWLTDLIQTAGSVVAVVGATAVAVILLRRWRAAPPPSRRALAPVLLTGAVMLACLALLMTLDRLAGESAAQVASFAALLTLAAVPFAFLVGLYRTRAWRAGALTDLVDALGAAPAAGALRDALAEALGDPKLAVAYWLPEREHHVDHAGRVVALPREGEARVATRVEREGRRVGALIHDAALCEEPELVRSVAAAASLALANERLEAELRARVEELRRSRRWLLDAGMAERRRLERDLHDGAQQRLVSLSLRLGMVARKLEGDDAAGAATLLDGAREEARAALEDLRELARGIHPAVLTDRGLGPALEALADRAPVPVEVDPVEDAGLPPAVEAAAYFVVAEALTNVAKYARATHARVHVGRENGQAVVEVRDDGVGGADPASGTGLRGLADRVGALDGRLEVESEPGRGTVVRARMPCEAT